jgi:hypothetical protein
MLPALLTAHPVKRTAPGGESRPRRRKGSRDMLRRALYDGRMRARHRLLRTRLRTYVLGADLATLVTAPVVYSVVLPFFLLDAWVSAYQAICFRAWRIRRVRRGRYIRIDRHKLAYLNGFEKLNCLFCSYANGVIAYVREVAARTEQYWCPIRHARRVRAPHERYARFAAYGDAPSYRKALRRGRESLGEPPDELAHE